MSEPFIAEIKMFGGNFAPRGYAYCAGQILAIAQNSALFALLGTTYGGNGQVTFGLPDLRGRVPVGQGQGPGLSPVQLGQVGGTETVTLTAAQLPPHMHSVNQTASPNPGTLNVPTTGSMLAQSNQRDAQFIAAGDAGTPVLMNTINTGLVGGGQSIPIMQPYLGINFIIALEGIFPSRN